MKTILKKAIYRYADALDFAESILAEEAKGGYIKEGVVDDACTYSFDEIATWSGETGALYVYDNDCNTVAIIAYWE